MYSVIQKGLTLSLTLDMVFKLFDTCVAPIVLYGAEVWGYENCEILEKVHTKFLKIITKSSKYAHNTSVYG
jgi:hypothetical protein